MGEDDQATAQGDDEEDVFKRMEEDGGIKLNASEVGLGLGNVSLPKKIVKFGDLDLDDEVLKIKTFNSEAKMREWMDEFINQINDLNQFYVNKFNEYVIEFVDLQVKYLTKLEKDKYADFEDDEVPDEFPFKLFNPLDGKEI